MKTFCTKGPKSINELQVFIIVGVLGSFTTFSAFSLDVVVLLQRNELFAADLYILGSVVVSILSPGMGGWLYGSDDLPFVQQIVQATDEQKDYILSILNKKSGI